MIREFIIGVPMLEIHRRLQPRTMPEGAEAYVALYIRM
jgi:hypothetical protein